MKSYALNAKDSKGRYHKEPEGRNRDCYQRDRDRIIHTGAFRRLQYKTQVFVNHEGDYYRTRLTHTLEVAQLSRSVARELSLNEDAAEAFALSHDLGHPPFGHAGEDALSEAMEKFGGFDHNAQTLRVITKLETIYAEFDGLNLTWETLEGIVKHNGPLKKPYPRAITEYCKDHDLKLSTYANLEAQVSSLCDDIAYNSHDVEDGLRAGLIDLDELIELPFVGKIFSDVSRRYKGLSQNRLIHESKRRIINALCSDLVETTRKNIVKTGVETADDVRALKAPLAAFSPQMQKELKELKAFLMRTVYRHYKVNRMTSKGRRVLKQLFEFFLEEPACLPPQWEAMCGKPRTAQTATQVCDYIAGMTDRYAFEEYRRIFDVNHKLLGV